METKLRDVIDKLRNEVANSSELQPERAAEIQTKLSALLGNLNDQIRFREMAYNQKLLELLNVEKSATHAKLKAQTTEEWEFAKEARDTKEVTIEMIRSLKYFLRSKEEEYMHS